MADLKASIGIEVTGTDKVKSNLNETTTALTKVEEAAGKAASSVDGLDGSVKNLGTNSASSSKTFETNMETAAMNAVNAFMEVVAEILEVNAAIIAGVNEVAEQGDAIAKGAKAIGFSAEAYQEWDFILKRSNSSISKASGAINKLTDAASSASKKQVEAFEALGLSMEEVQAMSPEQLFASVIEGLQGIENQGQRFDIAQKLFGSYKSLGTLLNSTSGEVDELRDKAYELHQVMSEEDIAAAESYQDSIENLQATISGIKTMVFDDLMPGLTKLRDSFTDLLAKVDWNALGNALEGIYTPAVNFLTDFLIPFASLNLTGVTGMLGTLQAVLVEIGKVVRGEESLGEGLDNLWSYGEWDAETPEKMLADYQGLAVEAEKTAQALQTAPGGMSEFFTAEMNAEQLAYGTRAVEDFGAALRQQAAEAENAEQANAWLAEQLGNLTTAWEEEAQAQAGESFDDSRREAFAQTLGNIAKQYLDLANQTPVTDTAAEAAANATEAAETIMQSQAQVEAGAGTMLDTFDSATSQLSTDFVEGVDEMSQAAADSVTGVNDALSANMAIVSANAQVWGTDMMISFANGLAAGWSSYTGPQLEAIAQAIQDMFGHSEPKSGPLANDSTWMPDMMESFAAGIRDNKHLVLSQFDALADDMGRRVNVGLSAGGAGANYNYGGVNVTFAVQEGQNGRELFEEFSFWLQNDMAREGAVWAH